MDTTYPDIDDDEFQLMDWKEFYGDVMEHILPNNPKPLCNTVDVLIFVARNFYFRSDEYGCKMASGPWPISAYQLTNLFLKCTCGHKKVRKR